MISFSTIQEKMKKKTQFQHCTWPICDNETAFFDDLSILQKRADHLQKSDVFLSGDSVSVWLHVSVIEPTRVNKIDNLRKQALSKLH